MTVWSLMPLGYWHELDLLEIKLREQASIVDRFVVSEAEWTYDGTPKPQHLDVRDARWDAWRGMLETIHVHGPAPDREPHQSFGVREHWQRENYQRYMLGKALNDRLEPDDIVIVSDLDEVLRASAILKYTHEETRQVVLPEIPMHRHYLNLRWKDRMALSIARIMRGQTIIDLGMDVEEARWQPPRVVWSVPHWNAYHDPLYDSSLYGWHFSWMGGTRAIDDKLRRAAHPEEIGAHNSTRTAIRNLVRKGGDLQGEHRTLYYVPDDFLPAAALDPKFDHLRCGPERATPDEPRAAVDPDYHWRG